MASSLPSTSRLGAALFRSLPRVVVAPAATLALAHAPVGARTFVSATQPLSAAKAKARAVPTKKKTAVRKKTSSGPRSTGGKRKGGADSTASLSRSSEFYVEAPNHADLPVFHPEQVTPAAVAQSMALSPRALAAFKAFGLPRSLARQLATQSRPRTLVRPQTLSLLDRLDSAGQGSPAHEVLVGAPGCGKSMLLMQATAYALESSWIVLYLPRALDYVVSASPYAYSASQQTYLQPSLARDVLKAILEVNTGLLKDLSTTKDLQLERAGVIAKGTTLEKLAKTGIEESTPAPARQQVLEHLVQELASQKQHPVLLAIDDFQALFRPTKYRDPDFAVLQSYELALPRMLLGTVTSRAPYALSRGAVIGALSTSASEHMPPAELLVALQEAARAQGGEPSSSLATPLTNAYTNLHPIHLANARAGLKAVEVGQPLGREEAAGLFASLVKDRMLHSPPNDELFIAKLLESGGNARTFERSLRSTLL